MTKPYEPTEAEIEALRMEMDGAMYLFSVYTDFPGAARWILQRFVRREEAEGRKHLDLLLEDNARLRTELQGQRCSAPSITPESMSLLEHHCSDADFAAIGKLRDESYAAGYQAGRDDAARLNIKSVEHVVKLHPETVRALVAAIIGAGGKDWHVVEDAIDATDHLLTHLCEKEKTR